VVRHNTPPSATTFDEWWTGVISGPVADGLLLALDGGTWTADHRHRLFRLLIEPLIA